MFNATLTDPVPKHPSFQEGPFGLEQGACLTFLRQITDAHRPWSRALKGEWINLPWQEDCVSLYTPYSIGGEGAKMFRARSPEGRSAKQQWKVKWQKGTVLGRGSRKGKIKTKEQRDPNEENRLNQMKFEEEDGIEKSSEWMLRSRKKVERSSRHSFHRVRHNQANIAQKAK